MKKATTTIVKGGSRMILLNSMDELPVFIRNVLIRYSIGNSEAIIVNIVEFIIELN